MLRSLDSPDRLLLVCGGLSLLAVALGAGVCGANGIPASLWGRNIAGWVVGGLAALGLARATGAWLFPAVLTLAGAGLMATLLDAGQMGVHRWVSAGPLYVNMAMLVLPAAVVALAARRARWSWLLAAACLVLLVVQPDASQATAFGGALIWIAVRAAPRGWLKAAVVIGTLGLVVGAWRRPDSLQPVPEVEGILQLAYAVSPILAGSALASLLLFAVAPGLLARGAARDAEVAGGALSLYLLLTAVAPFLGAFPVPLVGVGLSPVLGAWIGVGLLAALLRAPKT